MAMVADWQFAMDLDDQARALVLARARTLRGAVPKDSSSVGEVVEQFIDQVQAAAEVVHLRLGGLDLYGMVHLATVLEALAPATGRLRCITCGGSGERPVPKPVQVLYDRFLARYQLGQVMDDTLRRQALLDQPADAGPRNRIAAERDREAQKRAAAIRSEEARSRRVLPAGELAPGEDLYEAAKRRTVADFMPASAGKQLEDA